jgi:hypothetical protein
MVYGFQLRPGRMAEFTTVRRVDFVMADQAISHLRHIRVTYSNGFLEPAMASLARIFGIEETPNVARRRKIRPLVDRLGDHGCDVSEG